MATSAKRSVCISKNGARWKPVGTPYRLAQARGLADELLDPAVGRARQAQVGLDARAHAGARGVGLRETWRRTPRARRTSRGCRESRRPACVTPLNGSQNFAS